MARNIHLLSRVKLLIIFCLTGFSCSEETALKTDYYNIKNENRDWLPDSVDQQFLMTDGYGISHSFSFSMKEPQYTYSSSSYFGIRTHITHREEISFGGTSNYGLNYSGLLTAGFTEFGDNLTVNLDGLLFSYDFYHTTISNVSYNNQYKSKMMTDKGYIDTDTILSSVVFIDSLSIDQKVYKTVMHFMLKDFRNGWNEYTITDVYFAKHFGLVKYVYQNGISCQRK